MPKAFSIKLYWPFKFVAIYLSLNSNFLTKKRFFIERKCVLKCVKERRKIPNTKSVLYKTLLGSNKTPPNMLNLMKDQNSR